jgi:hypothetical protein
MKMYRNQTVEEIATRRITELEKVLKVSVTPPVPIDILAEKVLGLDFLWEEIEEMPGEVIWGGLIPSRRLIVLNEKRKKLFEQKPGLERSTKGHEMGHWDLFIDKTSDGKTYQTDLFPQTAQEQILLRSFASGNVNVFKLLQSEPEGMEVLSKISRRADYPHEARAVNRYAAVISMPKQLVLAEILKIDRTQWVNLYPLAEKFGVTISALIVRLQQLNLLYVGEDKKLFQSKEEALGQGSLKF